MLSTMQDAPLTVTQLLRHGQRVHRRSQVITFEGDHLRSASFAEVGGRIEQLAAALVRLGVGPGDRVATFMWNSQEHLEAYFAVPGIGAVLHTLNLRLFPQHLIHIVNEAEDRVILVHRSVLPVLLAVAEDLESVEWIVVVDDVPAGAEGGKRLRYEELLAAEQPGFAWPELDECSAAGMCYTSGTTGDPKGVVYSHRSTFLHTLAINNTGGMHLRADDRVMVVVPMFHVNAWGHPYAAWMLGADIIMPARFLQGGPLLQLIELARPTLSAGVPSIWADLLKHIHSRPEADISSLRQLMSGGSALPQSLADEYEALGIELRQGWGMTETSPICAVGQTPKGCDPGDVEWRRKSGRIIPGVDVRIITMDGEEASWDGTTTGEIEVRGPWVTGSYYRDPAPEKFHDGWLRTGDIASIDDYGFLQISDRVKDVIKSGGEWISSVTLETELMNHPAVAEAAVIGVADDRWGERPLALVVLRSQVSAAPEELQAFLVDRVARWWLPERWTFVDVIPKTSVGKFDKKEVRTLYANGKLEVTEI